jgi:hypothetical protein
MANKKNVMHQLIPTTDAKFCSAGLNSHVRANKKTVTKIFVTRSNPGQHILPMGDLGESPSPSLMNGASGKYQDFRMAVPGMKRCDSCDLFLVTEER